MKRLQKLNFRWLWMQNWAKQGGQMGFFSSALGKQRQRGKRKQTDNYTGISSLLAREFIQPPPPREPLSNWKPVFIQKLPPSTVKMWVYNQAAQTARQLHFWTVTMVNYSVKPGLLTHIYFLFLKRSSWGFLRQTDILCSVAGQQLVGQWLIS